MAVHKFLFITLQIPKIVSRFFFPQNSTFCSKLNGDLFFFGPFQNLIIRHYWRERGFPADRVKQKHLHSSCILRCLMNLLDPFRLQLLLLLLHHQESWRWNRWPKRCRRRKRCGRQQLWSLSSLRRVLTRNHRRTSGRRRGRETGFKGPTGFFLKRWLYDQIQGSCT